MPSQPQSPYEHHELRHFSFPSACQDLPPLPPIDITIVGSGMLVLESANSSGGLNAHMDNTKSTIVDPSKSPPRRPYFDCLSKLPQTVHTWLQALLPATTLLLLTCHAHNSENNSNKYLFSSFNGIDLLRSMLADCCLPRCQEWGTMAAMGGWRPPWLACVCISPSFS